jgi:hypothetical protein
MYDDPDFTANNGNLTRTWIIFFERLLKATGSGSGTGGGTGGAAGPFQRTLLLKDTTVGNDIADHVVVYGSSSGHTSTAQRMVAVLRKAITSDLTVRINLYSSAGVLLGVVGTYTIPHATAINTVITSTTFTTSSLPDESVLTWDVTASDGSADGAGVATVTLEWA